MACQRLLDNPAAKLCLAVLLVFLLMSNIVMDHDFNRVKGISRPQPSQYLQRRFGNVMNRNETSSVNTRNNSSTFTSKPASKKDKVKNERKKIYKTHFFWRPKTMKPSCDFKKVQDIFHLIFRQTKLFLSGRMSTLCFIPTLVSSS